MFIYDLAHKTFNKLAICLSLFVLPAWVCAQVTVGQMAPAFSLVAADGKTVTLESLRGKTVVLEWTNHDCPYVRKHYDAGNMQTQQKEAAAAGVVWLQVISSAPGKQGFVDAATARNLNLKRSATPANTLLDTSGQVGKAYGARTTPHMYVINAQGTMVYQGGIDSIASARTEDIPKAEQHVRVALSELAAGKPVAKPVSKPYGCSVKYADS
jgi:peroxiredoxin